MDSKKIISILKLKQQSEVIDSYHEALEKINNLKNKLDGEKNQNVK